jgi:hypothetical protein
MRTAKDVGNKGFDNYTGAGKVNVTAAAEYIDPSVPLTITANKSQINPGEWVAYEVRRSDTDELVNATITIGDESTFTGPDGIIRIYYPSIGTWTLTASPTTDPPTADFAAVNRSVTVSPPPIKTQDAVTWIAPTSAPTDSNILAQVTRDSKTAIGDKFVIQIDATNLSAVIDSSYDLNVSSANDDYLTYGVGLKPDEREDSREFDHPIPRYY